MNLGQFDKKYLKSIENEIADDKDDSDDVDTTGKERPNMGECWKIIPRYFLSLYKHML